METGSAIEGDSVGVRIPQSSPVLVWMAKPLECNGERVVLIDGNGLQAWGQH
jgi:hypothetical protein